MDKVKAVTYDDEWQLVSEFCFLFVTTSGGKQKRYCNLHEQKQVHQFIKYNIFLLEDL